MSLTIAKRKFLAGILFFQSLSFILLLICCTLPNWWLFEYKDGSEKINVKCGLWRTCYERNSSEVCQDYIDVASRKSRIEDFNVIRAFLVTAIILICINLLLGIILFFNHTINVLLSIITSMIILSWLIGAFIGICIGFSVIEKADPSPPPWAVPGTPLSSRDYGWAFFATCVVGVMAFLLIILTTCLLCLVLMYRNKYKHIAKSSSTASSRLETFKDYDMNGNFMIGKIHHDEVAKAKKEQKEQPQKFMTFNNDGFLPDKRTTTISTSPKDDVVSNRSDSSGHYYPRVIVSNHDQNPNGLIQLTENINGHLDQKQTVYYADYDDGMQPTFISAVNGEFGKRDKSQQTSSEITHHKLEQVPPAHTRPQPVTYPHQVFIPKTNVEPENRKVYTVQYSTQGRKLHGNSILSESAQVIGVAQRNHGYPTPDY